MKRTKGGFTLPGESGYEALTLQLAEKWGADVIRDSDGTELSREIIDAGYGIYSTICIIRDHNAWANKNLDALQQTFLMSEPVIATDTTVTIDLLEGYFGDQFAINDTSDSLACWQVFDRTTNEEISTWEYADGKVTLKNVAVWHKYTVNFLAWRIWEEISMYNHTTNQWDKEHLMQIDPIYPKVQQYLLEWMEDWCVKHPKTTVVRFTSMFYNFVWIWGSNERNRNRFTDWASYDFTVSPAALKMFEEKYGYKMTSEDFINQGKLHATHLVADEKKSDWMCFINDFVIMFGKQLIDVVHRYGKQAYVFYDDSWVGIEPWGERFGDFGFDGLIKCVFSGFECRLCAGVKSVRTHEIRLHPYLFPVGLGGAPTFSVGGNPTYDTKMYWRNVRRALLREPVNRIGLGGYLSLTIPFPDFQDYMEKLANEFRLICSYHENGKPYLLHPKIYILTAWGRLRAWTCAGHYHEHPELDLINVLEALSGMPFDVDFISFQDVQTKGIPADAAVIINAGFAGSAWSGGKLWNERIVSKVTEWVYHGGAFIGVNEPSATEGYDTFFRLAHLLGVDKDTGERICHGKYSFIVDDNEIVCEGTKLDACEQIYLTDPDTKVLLAEQDAPLITMHAFGKGMGVYLSSFTHDDINNKTLMQLILKACGEEIHQEYITNNPYTECSYYPEGRKLVVINNSDIKQKTRVRTGDEVVEIEIEPFDIRVYDV